MSFSVNSSSNNNKLSLKILMRNNLDFHLHRLLRDRRVNRLGSFLSSNSYKERPELSRRRINGYKLNWLLCKRKRPRWASRTMEMNDVSVVVVLAS